MTRTPLAALLAAALAALVLTACGEREDPAAPAQPRTDQLDVVLDYLPNADHAGLYTAIDSGAFRDVRLDVEAQVPSDPAAPLRLLAAGRADLAISYEPEVLLARDKGAKLVSIGALVQVPLTSLISIGDRRIESPAELAGKTVGTAGIPYQDAYLKAILDEAGVERSRVKTVNVGFNLVPAMLNNRVDATLGAFWNVEGVDLERRDRRPSVLRIEKLGVPTYDELVVVAREQDAREKGALLRRFMLGLARGHERLRDDPAAGLRALLGADRSLDRGLQQASIEATLPVFFPEKGRPFGWQDESAWAAYGAWMRENGLLTRPLDPRRALTDEFLPGEGPTPDES